MACLTGVLHCLDVFFFLIMYLCEGMYTCVQVPGKARRGINALHLQLGAAWAGSQVLETKLWSVAEALITHPTPHL